MSSLQERETPPEIPAASFKETDPLSEAGTTPGTLPGKSPGAFGPPTEPSGGFSSSSQEAFHRVALSPLRETAPEDPAKSSGSSASREGEYAEVSLSAFQRMAPPPEAPSFRDLPAAPSGFSANAPSFAPAGETPLDRLYRQLYEA